MKNLTITVFPITLVRSGKSGRYSFRYLAFFHDWYINMVRLPLTMNQLRILLILCDLTHFTLSEVEGCLVPTHLKQYSARF